LWQWETLRLADKRERYAAEAVRALRYAFAKHLTAPAGDGPGRRRSGARRPDYVALWEQAQAILRAAPRIEREAAEVPELVFPGQRGPFSGFSTSKEALDGDSGVRDWRLHDLRRTMATGLQRLGVRLEVTEARLPAAFGRRSRCCSPISSESFVLLACPREVQTGQGTSSCSPQPYRTCGALPA
jgi:hypothetical protein